MVLVKTLMYQSSNFSSRKLLESYESLLKGKNSFEEIKFETMEDYILGIVRIHLNSSTKFDQFFFLVQEVFLQNG
jgi:hypothetical protein